MATVLGQAEQPAALPPDMQEMAHAPTSYVKKRGSRFGELVENGTFGIVKGGYFEDCLERGEPFQCRQKIPPEYMWDPGEASENWEKYGPMFLVVISYAWLSAAHPDPELWHLRRLAKIIHLYRRHLGRHGSLPDIGVIIDYCSFWQEELVDGVDQRTDHQRKQFKEALREINTPYGHQEIVAWVLMSVPPSVPRKYEDRGWTLFEKNILDSKGMKLASLSSSITFGDDFEPNDYGDGADTTALFDPGSSNSRMDFSFQRAPPLTPERFEAALQERSQRASAKGVLLFTNGKEDQPLVIKKYRDSFQELAKTIALDYTRNRWGPGEVELLAEALPHFKGLEILYLSHNRIGSSGARFLADALPRCPALRDLNIDSNAIGLAGQLQLLRAWMQLHPGACSRQSCCTEHEDAGLGCACVDNCVVNLCLGACFCYGCCGNGGLLLGKREDDGAALRCEAGNQFWGPPCS